MTMQTPRPGGATRRQFLRLITGLGALLTGAALGLWRKSWGRATPPLASQGTAATAPGTSAVAPPPSPPATPASTAPPATSTVTSPPPPPTSSLPPSSTAAPTTTIPPGRVVEVIERAAWGAEPATGPFPSHTIDRITVHHSAGVLTDNTTAPTRVKRYQTFHQQRGFVDIAYHFMIDRHGNVYEARDFGTVGETFTSYDPAGHFLPMLDGNFEEQDVTEEQYAVLVDLVAWAVAEFGVTTDTIAGHRDYAATLCPGERLYDRLVDGSLQGAVAARLAAGGARLVYLRGDEALARVAAIVAGQA